MTKGQLIIFGFIGVVTIVALGLLTGIIPGAKPRAPAAFTLEMWGVGDDPKIWETIADEYQKTVSTATIHYTKKDPKSYEAELLNALAAGKGPDIFLLKDSLIAKHKDKIMPIPDGTLGYQKQNLKSIFPDAIASGIVDGHGSLLGVPLVFDTLGLFYNSDTFNAANIPAPPKTWDELLQDAETLTVLSDIGTIQRSGVALGTAANIEHASDLFAVILAQQGGDILKTDEQGVNQSTLSGPKSASTLAFYTAFADVTRKSYSWNGLFANSFDAFASGNTAMVFGYASDVAAIAAKNPQLNFNSAALPQIDPTIHPVNIGRFSIFAVSRTSRQTQNAWPFLLWLEDPKIQKRYADAVGLPPGRRDLVTSSLPRDYLAPFYREVLSARAIAIPLDDSLAGILNAMIESVVNHRFTVSEALARADRQISKILSASAAP